MTHSDNSRVTHFNMPGENRTAICLLNARLPKTWATVLQWMVHATQLAQAYCNISHPVEKSLGRWSSDAYETYIHIFQAIPQLLARTDTR